MSEPPGAFPTPMIPLRFDCVFYYVTDLDRALAFYTGLLGLILVSRDAVARLTLDGVLIELVPTADSTLVGGSGNARLTFAVDDIHATCTALTSQGVAVRSVKRVSNGYLAQAQDPDGNEFLLWQYA